MKRFAFLAAVACLLGCAVTGTSRADFIVDFSYSGSGVVHGEPSTATGTGSFSFASGLTTVGLSDLTSFSFTQTFSAPGVSLSGTFNYGLSDLASFSATIGPGPTVTALSLVTNFVDPSPPVGLWGERLGVTGLGTNEASTQEFPPHVGLLTDTTGTVTITSPSTIPEPASLSLASVGVLCLVGYGWRRRRRAAV